MTDNDLEHAAQDPGIVRNRRKIKAAVASAQRLARSSPTTAPSMPTFGRSTTPKNGCRTSNTALPGLATTPLGGSCGRENFRSRPASSPAKQAPHLSCFDRGTSVSHEDARDPQSAESSNPTTCPTCSNRCCFRTGARASGPPRRRPLSTSDRCGCVLAFRRPSHQRPAWAQRCRRPGRAATRASGGRMAQAVRKQQPGGRSHEPRR
jgi:hypothetical protein